MSYLRLFVLIGWFAAMPVSPTAEGEYTSSVHTVHWNPWDFPTQLDDGIFNLEPTYPPLTSESGRYFARTPRYKPEQRREWIHKCEHLKEPDFRQFQLCFREHRARFRRLQR